jgi:ElaB/YqjD/DUF883 family membrane-anchored ribosome-binding protein
MGTKTNLAEQCAAASREIEETRGRISAAAERVQNRLRPRSLLNPVRQRLRHTLGAGGEKILDSFRDNPIPLALTGIGLGWLLLRDMRGSAAPASGGIGTGVEKAKETAGEAIEKTKDAAQGAIEKTRNAAQKVREAASSVPRKVKQGVRKTSDWFSTTLEENPLVLALGILAVGIAAGLSFPASRKEKEEETMGKMGEKAAEAALDKGVEAIEEIGGEPFSQQEPSKAPTGFPEGPESAP